MSLAVAHAWAGWRPPLAQQERAQVETADDFTNQLDEGALYPLLRNALKWDQKPPVPNYMELQLHPDRFRGELFTVEGAFGIAREGVTLARPGPWGQQLTEWLVVVREEQQLEGRTIPQEVAILLIVDPHGELATPRNGQQVQLAAMFYKMLRTRLAGSSETADFPVFVAAPGLGGTPSPVQQISVEQNTTLQTLSPFLLIAVIGCFGLYIFVRHWSKHSQPQGRDPRAILAARRAAAAKREREHTSDLDETEEEESLDSLPKDPVQAMEALQKRIDKKQLPRNEGGF